MIFHSLFLKRFLSSLLASLPALLIYLVALPWAALRLDRWFGLVWRLPFWIEPVAACAMFIGAAISVWSFWALTFRGDGTPNPLVPTARLVASGPFRRPRNPLMLGGWLYGAGLACLLRSPCLLGLVGLVAIAGTWYVDPPAVALRRHLDALHDPHAPLDRAGAGRGGGAGRSPGGWWG